MPEQGIILTVFSYAFKVTESTSSNCKHFENIKVVLARMEDIWKSNEIVALHFQSVFIRFQHKSVLMFTEVIKTPTVSLHN